MQDVISARCRQRHDSETSTSSNDSSAPSITPPCYSDVEEEGLDDDDDIVHLMEALDVDDCESTYWNKLYNEYTDVLYVL